MRLCIFEVFNHLNEIRRLRKIALVAVQIAICESEKAVSLVKGSEWQNVFTFQINHFAAGHQLYFANGFTGDAKQIVADCSAKSP